MRHYIEHNASTPLRPERACQAGAPLHHSTPWSNNTIALLMMRGCVPRCAVSLVARHGASSQRQSTGASSRRQSTGSQRQRTGVGSRRRVCPAGELRGHSAPWSKNVIARLRMRGRARQCAEMLRFLVSLIARNVASALSSSLLEML